MDLLSTAVQSQNLYHNSSQTFESNTVQTLVQNMKKI